MPAAGGESKNGMVNFAYNGVVNSEYGWWFIRNGSIDFTYTGLAQNEYGWWRIVTERLILAQQRRKQ